MVSVRWPVVLAATALLTLASLSFAAVRLWPLATGGHGSPSVLEIALPPVPGSVAAVKKMVGDHAQPDPPATTTVAPATLRLVVSGIAFDEALTRAALGLPAAVALALPAEHPDRAALLEAWHAADREVALRLHTAPDTATDARVLPLAAAEAAAWSTVRSQVEQGSLADAVLLAEPGAGPGVEAALATAAQAWRMPVLLAADGEGSGVLATKRIDPGLLGQEGFARALNAATQHLTGGDDLTVALELYPGVVEDVQLWLADLERQGVVLVPLRQRRAHADGG